MQHMLSTKPALYAEIVSSPWMNKNGDVAKGVVKKDADGFYRGVLVGAIGTFNSSGEYYEFDDDIGDIILNRSYMSERLKKKTLFIESGHPKQIAHMTDGTVRALTDKEYVTSYVSIADRNVCGFVDNIKLEKATSPDKYGNYPILIYADIKPDGPFAHLLEQRMEDPSKNACFSMRYLADKDNSGPFMKKRIFDCITFDLVGEGGAELSIKSNHISFEENKQSVELTDELVNGIIDDIKAKPTSEESSECIKFLGSFLDRNTAPKMCGSFYI